MKKIFLLLLSIGVIPSLLALDPEYDYLRVNKTATIKNLTVSGSAALPSGTTIDGVAPASSATTVNGHALTSNITVTAADLNLGNVQNIKSNFTATAAPTATDDLSSGYAAGSLWIYDGTLYVCTNATTGAAVWSAGSGSGSGTNVLTDGYLFVGNSSNVATGVALSGDATITNAGVLTIAANAITNAKMATMPAYTLKANMSGSDAVPQDVTLADGVAALKASLTLPDTSITVDSSRFDGNLASGGSTLHGILDTIDNLSLGGCDAPAAADVTISEHGLPWFVSAGVSYGGTIVTDYVAKWYLKDSLADETGTYALTNNNSVTFAMDSTFPLDTRYVAVFNGENQLSFDPSGLPSGNATRTVCCWASITSSGAGLVSYGTAAGGEEFGMEFDVGKFAFENYGTTYYASDTSYNTGTWHFFSLSYDGTNLYFYVDASLIKTQAITLNTVVSGVHGNIGCVRVGQSYTTGSIADVRIYSRCLTATEIADIYAGEKGISWTTPSPSDSAIAGTEKISTTSGTTMVTHTQAQIVGSTPLAARTASDTFATTDRGHLVTMDSSSATTLTIGTNANVAIPVNCWIDVLNVGSGTCTITAASGVTLKGTSAGTQELKQWQYVRLWHTATDTWVCPTPVVLDSSAIAAALGFTPASISSPTITSPTFATSAAFSYATASTVPYFGSSKNLVSSAVTPTELGYLSGATSNLQTQITAATSSAAAKLPLAGGTLTGKLVTAASTTNTAGFNIPAGTAATSPSVGDFYTDSNGNLWYYNGTGWVELSSGGTYYYTPSMALDGTLSWSNNGGLTNPSTINLATIARTTRTGSTTYALNGTASITCTSLDLIPCTLASAATASITQSSFTGLSSGQGIILSVVNSGGTLTFASSDTNSYTLLSTTDIGTYWVGFYYDGTNYYYVGNKKVY